MRTLRRLLPAAAVTLALACGDGAFTTAPRLGGTDLVEELTLTGPTLTTDKSDYAPGETVTITGAGFAPFETVQLLMVEEPELHEDRVWEAYADSLGGFVDASFVPDLIHVGVQFTVTATGLQSGLSATVIFTDGTITNPVLTFYAGGSTTGSPPDACTGSTGSTVDNGTAMCAVASYTLSGTGATHVQLRWRNPSGNVVAVSQRSPSYPNGAAGANSFAATFTPTVNGTWTLFLCQSDNLNFASGPGLIGCQQNQVATAQFTVQAAPIVTHLLSVTKVGAGTGTVSSNPAGIDCGLTCSFSFNNGASVILTALADPGSTFNGWSGDGTDNLDGTRTVSMTAARSVTARFKANQTISFAAGTPTSKTFGDADFNVSATATSGLTVALAAKAGVTACTVTDNADGSATVSIVSVGSCVIVATQAGDGDYNAATPVEHTITIAALQTATTLVVSPNPQQYSDKVDLVATITPASAGGQSPTGSVQFQKFNGVAYVDIGSPVALVANVATLSGHAITEGAGTLSFKAVFASTNANFTGSNDTDDLTVNKEDATVAENSGNPSALQVSTPGGSLNANLLSLIFNVSETIPDLAAATAAAGNIDNAGLSVSLSPVAGGSSVALSCTSPAAGSGYATKVFTCTNPTALSVNTYEVIATVTGNFYTGSTIDAFTVYDPSLGFATGGGRITIDGDKVNFGFTMKYLKNGTSLQGNFIAVRHHADGTVSRIKANSLGGLAIQSINSCGVATFNGKATYTTWVATQYVTTGNNGFTVYAEDCNNPGSGVDAFWLSTVGNLNVGGTPAADKQTLVGGNIAVPHTIGLAKK